MYRRERAAKGERHSGFAAVAAVVKPARSQRDPLSLFAMLTQLPVDALLGEETDTNRSRSGSDEGIRT